VNNGLTFATFYRNHVPTSRIDHIWFPHIVIDDIIFDRTWSLPFTTLNTSTTTDHKCVLTYFAKTLVIPNLPIHRRKQKKEWREVYDLKMTNDEAWKNFTKETNLSLSSISTTHKFPLRSTFSKEQVTLNYRWFIFRKSTTDAAKKSIPVKFITPDAIGKSKDSSDLADIKIYIKLLQHSINVLMEICHPTATTKIHRLQYEWSGKAIPNGKSTYLDMCKRYNIPIDPEFNFDKVALHTPAFNNIYLQAIEIRKSLLTERILLEKAYTNQLIKDYENTRCENYASNKAAFISSALNRTKHSIVLDRAMISLPNGDFSLTVDPSKVK
jgi:hypothetical protein